MGEQNFQDNTIYELDNLDILRGMNSETVDLIATEPTLDPTANPINGHSRDHSQDCTRSMSQRGNLWNAGALGQ